VHAERVEAGSGEVIDIDLDCPFPVDAEVPVDALAVREPHRMIDSEQSHLRARVRPAHDAVIIDDHRHGRGLLSRERTKAIAEAPARIAVSRTVAADRVDSFMPPCRLDGTGPG
jgi:hypothetical protein